MVKRAVLVNDVVVELLDPNATIDGEAVPLEDRYHPDFLAQTVEVSDDVKVGALKVGDRFVMPENIVPSLTAEQARAERERLLNITDWTQLADVPAETQEKWRKYRQALRDVPAQSGFPDKIKWPKEPT